MPAQQQIMSAMPIVDKAEGNLEIRSPGGQQHVKVYNPSLNEKK